MTNGNGEGSAPCSEEDIKVIEKELEELLTRLLARPLKDESQRVIAQVEERIKEAQGAISKKFPSDYATNGDARKLENRILELSDQIDSKLDDTGKLVAGIQEQFGRRIWELETALQLANSRLKALLLIGGLNLAAVAVTVWLVAKW